MRLLTRDLGGEIRALPISDRETVGNAVMKQLKAIKAGIAKRIRASALLNLILDGSWPIALPKPEDTTEEVGTDTASDEQITSSLPQTASPSAPDIMPEILK